MILKLIGIFWLGAAALGATTLSLVTVFEPITLHGTDADEAGDGVGEGLQATVIPRRMVLSGAFPEALVEAIPTPHELASNDPGYTVGEVNLLVLCSVGLAAEIVDHELRVEVDVGSMSVPAQLRLTERQVVELAIVAIRKTLEAYQKPQAGRLAVKIAITGAEGPRAALAELGCDFGIEGG